VWTYYREKKGDDMRILGLAGLTFLAAMAAPAQQNNRPNSGVVIRTETKQVLVDAVVTTRRATTSPIFRRRFQVLEDGKEQSIRASLMKPRRLPHSTQRITWCYSSTTRP